MPPCCDDSSPVPRPDPSLDPIRLKEDWADGRGGVGHAHAHTRSSAPPATHAFCYHAHTRHAHHTCRALRTHTAHTHAVVASAPPFSTRMAGWVFAAWTHFPGSDIPRPRHAPPPPQEEGGPHYLWWHGGRPRPYSATGGWSATYDVNNILCMSSYSACCCISRGA